MEKYDYEKLKEKLFSCVLCNVMDMECDYFDYTVSFPGDIICGGVNGIVVIPPGITEKVFDLALERMNREYQTRDFLKQGLGIEAVLDKMGIL
jgi:regulator of RNase E activity RraA